MNTQFFFNIMACPLTSPAPMNSQSTLGQQSLVPLLESAVHVVKFQLVGTMQIQICYHLFWFTIIYYMLIEFTTI